MSFGDGDARFSPDRVTCHSVYELILGPDWRAMFANSARNLEERRTLLFNAVLERTD